VTKRFGLGQKNRRPAINIGGPSASMRRDQRICIVWRIARRPLTNAVTSVNGGSFSTLLFLAREGVEHVRSERHQPIGSSEAQMAQAIISTRRDSEQILIASERGEMVVRSRRIYRTRCDPFRVEQNSADLPPPGYGKVPGAGGV